MRSAVESSKSDSSCILFYNPYSIVKELPIAKIGAELRLSTALTADSRGHSAARMMDNEEEVDGHSGSAVSAGRWWS
jgi:hypothetical protein